MEKEPNRQLESNYEEEAKIIDGKRYRRIDSGYTIKQYFSHETPEKGPGPGWDTRYSILEKYNVDDPSKLPDEPYYLWELVEDENRPDNSVG